MRNIYAEMIPMLPKEEEKERGGQLCHVILEQLEIETNLLKRLITGDESWIFKYNSETKRQSLQWKSPTSLKPKKARMSKSQIMVMLIAFFDGKGIVHAEFLPQGQTIKLNIYRDFLRRLMRSVREKRRQKIMAISPRQCSGAQCIEHPGICCQKYHCCAVAISILARLGSQWFFLFPKFKGVMKETRFPDVEAKMAVTKELRAIPDRSFHECMRAWQRRMAKCTYFEEDYFEEDML